MSSFFILKDRNFQSLRGALHCEFSSLNEVTSPHAVAVTLAKGREQDNIAFGGRVMEERDSHG